MKHTPGPWRTADSEAGMPAIRSCEGAPRTIALIDVRFPHLVSPEERLANARLIAAAPELLEALQACLVVLRADSDSEEDNATEIKQAQSAIKKAEGL